MNKGLKVALGLGGGAILAGLCYRQYKKELTKIKTEEKNIERREETLKVEAEKIGINKEKFDKELSKDGCFLKAIYTGLRFNPRFDLDLFDLDNGYSSDFTIAVNLGVKDGQTEFQCRLKDSDKYNDPKVADYIRCICETLRELREEKNWNFWMNKSLVVYFRFTDNVTGLVHEKAIPQGVFNAWADERHAGEVSFYEDFCQGSVEAKQAIAQWLEEKGFTDICDTVMSLAYTITIEDKIGINPVLDLIEALLDVEITRNDNGPVYRYSNIIVYAPDSEGVVSVETCYDTNEVNEVIVTEC